MYWSARVAAGSGDYWLPLAWTPETGTASALPDTPADTAATPAPVTSNNGAPYVLILPTNKKKDAKDSKSGSKPKAVSKKEGGGGGKAKKKKWTKGKVRDKLNNAVMFDKTNYDKLIKEVPMYKLITPSVVSERLKVRASVAKNALKELATRGLVKQLVGQHGQLIYTRATKAAVAGEEA